MTAHVTTTHGTYRGATVESIVRRIYGKTAFIRYSADRNSPELGLVVTPAYKQMSAWDVQAKVWSAVGDREDQEAGL